MEERKLVKVSTYARERGVSVTMVYKMIANGAVESTEIDGVKFIVLKKEEETEE